MVSTQDLKGLLKAIKNNPNDRVARLALADLFEEQGLAEDARRQREVVALLSRWHDIRDVKEANAKAGFHWFSKDTMRAFKSKVYPCLYIGTAGIFFVSSEQFMDDARRYTVRRFNPVECTVGSNRDFDKYRTKVQAVTAARRAADGQE